MTLFCARLLGTLRAPLIALSASLVVALVACQRDEARLPSEPDELELAGKGDCPQIASELIGELFDRGNQNAIIQQCNNIQRQFSRGEDQAALAMLNNLIEKILRLRDQDKLVGDPDHVPPLIVELLKIVGATGELPAGASSEVCVPPNPCRLVADDRFSGVIIPQGVNIFLNGVPYTGPFVVFTAPLPFDESPFPGFEVGVSVFPLIREIGTIPEGLVFTNGVAGALAPSQVVEGEGGPVVVGVCVLDPPHSLAPNPEDVDDLRLAHLVDGEVEVTPLADVTGLIDCTDVNSSVPDDVIGWRGAIDALLGPAARFFAAPSLHASPGQLGGSISSFSPFGAVLVDGDGDGELTCHTVTFEGIGDFAPVGTVVGTPTLTFGSSWLGIIDSDAGGSGNFANEPSPSTTAFFLDTEDILIGLDVGSRTVEFFYSASAASLPVTLEAFDSEGSLIGSAEGNTVGSDIDGADCVGDPTGQLCLWDSINLASTGDDIRSIRITGAVNQFVIDDLEVCTGASPPIIESRIPRLGKVAAPAAPARRPAGLEPGAAVEPGYMIR